MQSKAPPSLDPGQFLATCIQRPRLWLGPTVVLGLLAAAYALVRPATWEATQTLTVRDEAAASKDSPGRFSQPEQLKTVQETILELTLSRGVLQAALESVGPRDGGRKPSEQSPTPQEIADLRDVVKVSPPAGSEFGTTEVFYLKVRDHNRARALELVSAIHEQLEDRFQQLRDAKARSMIDELAHAVQLARTDLAESTSRLSRIEKQVGSDLVELRILNESTSGESGLQRMVTQIESELRQARVSQQGNQELLMLLQEAGDNPDRLVATPNRLLESQPALRLLKDGLIAAQLHSSALLGTRTEQHPLVQAARYSEREIARNLRAELDYAIGGLKVELRLDTEEAAMLQDQRKALAGKIDKLAGVRAEYANQLAETRNHNRLLEQAEERLAEARMSQATAKAASLIGRIDSPDTGVNPVGPGRFTIMLIGLAGGLFSGLGLVLMVITPAVPEARSAEPGQSFAPQPTTEVASCPNGHGRLNPLTIKQALGRIASIQTWN